jgi:hypothetical protein
MKVCAIYGIQKQWVNSLVAAFSENTFDFELVLYIEIMNVGYEAFLEENIEL